MDRCNATRDFSPCTNCNGAECSERTKQPKTNQEWLNRLPNKELAEIMLLHCPPDRYLDPSTCKYEEESCKACWVDWMNQPVGIKCSKCGVTVDQIYRPGTIYLCEDCKKKYNTWKNEQWNTDEVVCPWCQEVCECDRRDMEELQYVCCKSCKRAFEVVTNVEYTSYRSIEDFLKNHEEDK